MSYAGFSLGHAPAAPENPPRRVTFSCLRHRVWVHLGRGCIKDAQVLAMLGKEQNLGAQECSTSRLVPAFAPKAKNLVGKEQGGQVMSHASDLGLEHAVCYVPRGSHPSSLVAVQHLPSPHPAPKGPSEHMFLVWAKEPRDSPAQRDALSLTLPFLLFPGKVSFFNDFLPNSKKYHEHVLQQGAGTS